MPLLLLTLFKQDAHRAGQHHRDAQKLLPCEGLAEEQEADDGRDDRHEEQKHLDEPDGETREVVVVDDVDARLPEPRDDESEGNPGVGPEEAELPDRAPSCRR